MSNKRPSLTLPDIVRLYLLQAPPVAPLLPPTWSVKPPSGHRSRRSRRASAVGDDTNVAASVRSHLPVTLMPSSSKLSITMLATVTLLAVIVRPLWPATGVPEYGPCSSTRVLLLPPSIERAPVMAGRGRCDVDHRGAGADIERDAVGARAVAGVTFVHAGVGVRRDNRFPQRALRPSSALASAVVVTTSATPNAFACWLQASVKKCASASAIRARTRSRDVSVSILVAANAREDSNRAVTESRQQRRAVSGPPPMGTQFWTASDTFAR